MVRILHFADAHIDMANYGRHDPETGLPVRVMDFLKSLDTIVDAAIEEKVDLVLFAGDAYKDRNPAPTFQREWGRRIMRLSHADIPTLLLVGNHDLSPAYGRAHALAEYSTLEVPNIRVIDKPVFLHPADLHGLPLQVLALPWITRSGMMASLNVQAGNPEEVVEQIEQKVTELLHHWLDEADPDLPIVLTAHASVMGASYGSERTVMLGRDLVLPGALVKDKRLDYVALGHIHKPQDLNEGFHPPVIYPGSIERVDFGEVDDDKFFVVANVEKGKTEVDWRQLTGIRPFISRYVRIQGEDGVTQKMLGALPPFEACREAIVRLIVEYPRGLEPLIDESALRDHALSAFDFHLVKRPVMEDRIRLPQDQNIGSLTPLELLKIYWEANHVDAGQIETLQDLAAQIIRSPGVE